MAHRGIKARFKLDDGASPTTLTDISTYLDNITGGSAGETEDGTTFQPDVAVPVKVNIPTFSAKTYALTGKWTAAAETFFSAIEGAQGLYFEHGPTGSVAGMTKIYGFCNCKDYSGPVQSVTGVITFTCNLEVTERNVGVWT